MQLPCVVLLVSPASSNDAKLYDVHSVCTYNKCHDKLKIATYPEHWR